MRNYKRVTKGSFQEQFIEKCKKKFKNKFTYNKVLYNTHKDVVTITCKKHGDFETKASLFIQSKYGCKKCRTEEVFVDRYITVETPFGPCRVTRNHYKRGKVPSIQTALNKNEYIKREFRNKHGDRYNYSLVQYDKSKTKVKIICKEHGVFECTPSMHKKGVGCKKCSYNNVYGGFGRSDFLKNARGRLCKLYIVEISSKEESFIKIGITSRTIGQRFKTLPKEYKYKLIYEESSIDAIYIFDRETYLHNILSEFKYSPKLEFKGKTECFIKQSLKIMQNEYRKI